MDESENYKGELKKDSNYSSPIVLAKIKNDS